MNVCAKRYVDSATILAGDLQGVDQYLQHPKFNKWGLLAAMQALSIYILIRLDEGETDHNNFDFLLTATVTVG